MKRSRFDKDGVPIIDEPLLSPKRIVGGIWLWAMFDADGIKFSLWKFVVYHRRPYASYKKGWY